MIIKFQSYDGTWQMFDDVDSLNYQFIERNRVLGSRTIYFTGDDLPLTSCENNIGVVVSERTRVLLAFMNSKQLEESEIVAFSPVFIMNNEGRTIETIR